jgi:short chain dehydrogenase
MVLTARLPEDVPAEVNRFGRLDCLVANAGTTGKQPFSGMPLGEWHRVLQVNLDGAFLCLCLREAARVLVGQGYGGSLVGVSSTSAIDGAPGQQHYAASKTALPAVMRALAVGLARQRSPRAYYPARTFSAAFPIFLPRRAARCLTGDYPSSSTSHQVSGCGKIVGTHSAPRARRGHLPAEDQPRAGRSAPVMSLNRAARLRGPGWLPRRCWSCRLSRRYRRGSAGPPGWRHQGRR